MPRTARIVVPDFPHHITQRGNYKQDVFLGDDDRERYLWWIEKYSKEYDTSILSYCLMQNHVHFIAIPGKEDSLAKTFKTAHMRYSQYFNKKNKTGGHLWQGRFYSVVLDEPHLIAAARYIERNPVRAKIVEKPWHWKWSSAQAHVNQQRASITLKDIFEYTDLSYDSWKQFIDSEEEDRQALEDIRKHTKTGRPLGEITFVRNLEKRFGKRFKALSVGRPKKGKK